jgi:hypothetical protein
VPAPADTATALAKFWPCTFAQGRSFCDGLSRWAIRAGRNRLAQQAAKGQGQPLSPSQCAPRARAAPLSPRAAAQLRDGEELAQVAPRRGGLLLFPHATPHLGNCVGGQRKALLRGDML